MESEPRLEFDPSLATETLPDGTKRIANPHVRKLIDAAVLAEREACAKAAEEIGARGWANSEIGFHGYIRRVAAEIRARK